MTQYLLVKPSHIFEYKLLLLLFDFELQVF